MTLYLVPNALDAAGDLGDHLPAGTIRTAARLGHWVAENARSARAFLNRVGAIVPLARPLQDISIVEWPRPPKGRCDAADAIDVATLLRPALDGHDLGLVSEAGLPALADPGSALVAAAHAQGIPVVALPGASAIALAVAASGLEGQRFAFVGYVPTADAERTARLVALEAASRRDASTQVLIETPYRNQALLEALVRTLQPATRLAVVAGLGTAASSIRSNAVADWRSAPGALPLDVPAVFLLLAVRPDRPPEPSRRTARRPSSSP